MLSCYPVEATQENWLHETLVTLIHMAHDQLDRGANITETQKGWNDLVESLFQCPECDLVIRSNGIRDRFFTYKRVIEALTPLERNTVLNVMEAQNQIDTLLSGHADIRSLNQFPDVEAVVKELFIFCFGKLTDFKVRERQYQIIYEHLPNKICPFCGIERVMHPDETDQDQDHYLAKSIYPFAAANMKNLVPMCRCCNRDYKKTADIIRDENGNRRIAFNPYECNPPKVTLINSQLVGLSTPLKPEWNVEFLPQSVEVETWDSVFDIRTRYKRDILGNYFDSWLRGFIAKCKRDRQRQIILEDLRDDEIRNHLLYYYEDKYDSPSIGNAGFLEPLAFEFLLTQYDAGNQRIVKLIRDAVLGIQMDEVA